MQQLNTERLANFIAISTRDFRGGWKAYNKKALEEFTIDMPQNGFENNISSNSKGEVLTLGF